MQSIRGILDSIIDYAAGVLTYSIIDTLRLIPILLGYEWLILILKLSTFLSIYSIMERFERSSILYIGGYFIGFAIMIPVLSLNIIDILTIIILLVYIIIKINNLVK